MNIAFIFFILFKHHSLFSQFSRQGPLNCSRSLAITNNACIYSSFMFEDLWAILYVSSGSGIAGLRGNILVILTDIAYLTSLQAVIPVTGKSLPMSLQLPSTAFGHTSVFWEVKHVFSVYFSYYIGVEGLHMWLRAICISFIMSIMHLCPKLVFLLLTFFVIWIYNTPDIDRSTSVPQAPWSTD